MEDKAVYRILTSDHRIKYAGTDNPSWFALKKARELVRPNEMIYQYCTKTMQPMWEVL